MKDATNAKYWTESRISALRELAAIEGTSATSIANALGPGVTRNAVCGKASKIGIKLTGKKYKPRADDRPVLRLRKPKAKTKKPFRFGPKKQTASAPPADLPRYRLPSASAPSDHATVLIDLRNDQCRWPLWGEGHDEPRLYCGAGRDLGLPYCPDHARLAYNR